MDPLPYEKRSFILTNISSARNDPAVEAIYQSRCALSRLRFADRRYSFPCNPRQP